ncbi:MAG: glycerate kinase [Tyzzerella sp.]|nr:glycerate kinase [Tyzzerella sp.]
MKIIVSPDSFKGSCSAIEVANSIEKAIYDVDRTVDVVKMPVADGGEGTIDAITSCVPSTIYEMEICDPMGKRAMAKYAVIDNGDTAIIEMAQASGLPMVPVEERNPLLATTYGTGQLMKDALDKGVKKMIIGIGGSATNDGGAGMLMALGASFRNIKGEEIALGGAALAELVEIDLSEFDSRIFDVDITVACDVTNPLTGENGASYVYGPQKGATPEMVEELDVALSHFAKLSAKGFGKDYSTYPGTGAAGGLGFALIAYCKAKFAAGIDIVLNVSGFEKELADADLVITGEGRIDGQSVQGKVLYGIGTRAKAKNVPVIAVGGAVRSDSEALLNHGITAMFSIANGPMTLEYAMEHGCELIEQVTKNVMRVFLH